MATSFLIAHLPKPPSTNNLYRNVPGVGRVSTPALLRFQREALICLSQAKHQDWQTIEYIRACKAKNLFLPLKIEIIFYYKTMWRQDGDSGIKATQDIIFQFLALNDTLVTDLDIKKRVNRENPHCCVRLSLANLEGDEQW
jgi:Endodeoxyribonuclease RusA